MGFADGLNMVDQRKKEMKCGPKIFGLCKSGLEHGVPEA